MQRPTGFGNDEAQRATEKEIDQNPSQMTNFDPDEARAIATKYKQDRAREIQRRLEAGEIKRIKNINCCRCYTWSGFPGGKCVDMYCQHRCCGTCLLTET